MKRILNDPKRGIGDGEHRQARRVRHRPRPLVHRRAAARRRRRGERARPPRGSCTSSTWSTASSELVADDRPAAAARAAARALRIPRRAPGRAHHREPRGGSRTWPSSSGIGPGGRLDRPVPRAGQPGGRRRRDRRRRQPGRAHDDPRGEGSRVPGRVRDRHGGRGVPAPPIASASPTRWRRNAASPTWPSPGPASGCT